MSGIARLASLGAVGAAVVLGSAVPAAAAKPQPEGEPRVVATVVRTVEVPVRDRDHETVQMVAAAAVGAAFATALRRRRPRDVAGVSGLHGDIDLTDTVQEP